MRRMTHTFMRSRKLLRLSRVAALVAAVGLLLVGGVAPATAAPDTGEGAAASVVRVDASQWDVAAKATKVIRAEVAAFPSGNVFCTSAYTAPDCLKALAGQVNYLGCGAESGGGDVDVVVRNPNRTRAPRDISVFIREGDTFRMIFGDRDWAQRGRNVVEYRGLSAGTYAIGVGWDDQSPTLTFFGNVFTVDC